MRKIFAILFCITFISVTMYAQTNDRIKQKSKENTENKSDNNNDNSDSSSASDECISSCLGCGFQLIFEVIADLILQSANSTDDEPIDFSEYETPMDIVDNQEITENEVEQEWLSENQNLSASPEIYNEEAKQEIDTSIAVTLGCQYGFMPTKHRILVPNVLISGNTFAGDFRLYRNVENNLNEKDVYSTFDAQIQFYLVNINEFKLALGTGIMHELEMGATYNEFSIRLELPFSERFALKATGRLSIDYQTVIIPRSEISGSFNYTVFKQNKFAASVSLGGFAANYYQEIEVNSLLLGVTISF